MNMIWYVINVDAQKYYIQVIILNETIYLFITEILL